MSLRILSVLLAALLVAAMPARTDPLFTPLQQAVAQAAAGDEAIQGFYRDRGFALIWSGEGSETRRAAFLRAVEEAGYHGLPLGRYDPGVIRAEFAAADASMRGALDVAMTRRLLRYAADISTGILDPKTVDAGIVLELPVRDRREQLDAFTADDPDAFLRSLPPASLGYARLLRERLRLAGMRDSGGWGPSVPREPLAEGDRGPGVIALRDRLMRMGYLRRTATATFDAAMAGAVRRFQGDHGLAADGTAGPETLAAINVPLADRMAQLAVGLERRRWMNKPLEDRHVLVNLAEQHAYVYDEGRVTFDTVVVVGAEAADRRTPEFSHEMTHLVVNPYWHVPRSITVNEYLPALRRGGARHLEVHTANGRVDRRRIDFSRYTAQNFPFRLKQAPGPGNALGRVKFMFPNRWNIYLHDTPSRDLFARDRRTFSHGCVRVARPLELAYHLLAPQTETPRADFDRALATGRERRIDLDDPIGVHLVYWSSWVTPRGRVNYRDDPYGRDARMIALFREAGVELEASRS